MENRLIFTNCNTITTKEIQMDILWAPWRSQYISSFKNEVDTGCFICDAIKDKLHEKERLVTYRSKFSIVMLNKYPYNGGHLLIAPQRHIGDYTELKLEEINDISLLTQATVKALKCLKNPDAFNIGMNVGRSAGAGLPGHIHQHVIPRWNGDSGFISSICDAKVVSEALDETYNAVKEALLNVLQ